MVLGKFPPGNFPPIKLPLEKFAPGKYPPGIFPPILLIVFLHLVSFLLPGGKILISPELLRVFSLQFLNITHNLLTKFHKEKIGPFCLTSWHGIKL